MVSLAPIPFATFGNHEQSHTGQNYLRSLFALGFQGFLIMICVGIYAVLIHICPVPLRVGKALQRNGAGSEQELFQKRTIETLLYGHAGCKPPALYRKCSG